MEKIISSGVCFVTMLLLLTHCLVIEAQTCRPSGRIIGKKPPSNQCNQENDSDCCIQGKPYTTYKCSPSITSSTKAVLTLNSFQKGGDGGGPSECDNQYHSDDTPVVALSTGWYNNGKRCLNDVIVSANGKSVRAKVVDECDSTMGCDSDHDYQPPCPNNIVDASKAVWKALGIPEGDWGELDITWTDTCRPSGRIIGKKPSGQCNRENDSDCCIQGKPYKTYKCSPPITSNTKAVLTLNSFQKGGDGGGPSECDNQYHSDDTPVVALSTGWYNNGKRCLNDVIISANGKSVRAKVVDECDSTMGCDSDHDYQPPCPNNIVDASKAVWKALEIPEGDWGDLDITWTDA
ncbi:uncharacterized protein LOC124910015 [Impatiens glandulifera]|uniref:uncharacterized protein LOC124910015 n=1 Tax=Impatiens glandulifera TaxID=253017 RepID=UPI001FB17A63|nr:uncharacterized protein LOC124910015 [Impatiens glandulifera]